jgi:hypothetical protein
MFANVVTLTHRMDKVERTVADQDRELSSLWDAVRQLTFEQQRAVDREANEREKFMLRVENQLLKAGRQLPSASEGGDKK